MITETLWRCQRSRPYSGEALPTVSRELHSGRVAM